MAFWHWALRLRNGSCVHRGITLAVALALSFAAHCAAQASVIPLSDREIQQYIKRLNLNEKQKPGVTSIMKRTRREGESVLKKYGISAQSNKKPGLFQMVTLKNDMNSVVKWSRAEMQKILTSTQMREFEKIYAEAAEVLRKRILK